MAYLDTLRDYELGFFDTVTGEYQTFAVSSLSPALAIEAGFNYLVSAHYYQFTALNIVSIHPPSKDIPS